MPHRIEFVRILGSLLGRGGAVMRNRRHQPEPGRLADRQREGRGDGLPGPGGVVGVVPECRVQEARSPREGDGGACAVLQWLGLVVRCAWVRPCRV